MTGEATGGLLTVCPFSCIVVALKSLPRFLAQGSTDELITVASIWIGCDLVPRNLVSFNDSVCLFIFGYNSFCFAIRFFCLQDEMKPQVTVMVMRVVMEVECQATHNEAVSEKVGSKKIRFCIF
jgi:hypothetical protein